MKHFVLFIILTFLINANSQIQGLQDYEHWLRKDSIDIGFKGFIYTDLNSYLKHYWYAERSNKEGFKIMWTELSRLLNLNQADINNPLYIESNDPYTIDLSNFNNFYKTTHMETQEIDVYWEIKDIHKAVEEYWILYLYIDRKKISIYVSSSYDFELIKRKKNPD